MSSDNQDDTKAMVRERLWERLDSAGVKPCTKMTQDGFAEMQKRMTPRLAYLGGDLLDVLAQSLIDVAARTRGERCPSEVVIRNLAYGLRKPPLREHEIVTSWLASVEGPPALAGGYAVTLLRWLIAHAPPGPMEFDMRKIKERARDDLRRNEVLERREADGRLTDHDREELAQWRRDVSRVQGIIADGVVRRTAKNDHQHEGTAA